MTHELAFGVELGLIILILITNNIDVVDSAVTHQKLGEFFMFWS